jgi:CheY-like chemotaxis protein
MILVVDDHADTCRLLVHFLSKEGIKSTSADSGEAALEHLRNEVPSMIVLDDFMPGMSGLEMIKELRKDPRYATVPIIFYSGKDDPDRRAEAMRLGATAWLEKTKTPMPEVVAQIKFLMPSETGE